MANLQPEIFFLAENTIPYSIHTSYFLQKHEMGLSTRKIQPNHFPSVAAVCVLKQRKIIIILLNFYCLNTTVFIHFEMKRTERFSIPLKKLPLSQEQFKLHPEIKIN